MTTGTPAITLGVLASFPSYNGQPHYGEVTELFTGPDLDGGSGEVQWAMVVGPRGPGSPYMTSHQQRSCPVSRLTVLDVPKPRPGQIWAFDSGPVTLRREVLSADGLVALCRSLNTGNVGTFQLVGYDWRYERDAA